MTNDIPAALPNWIPGSALALVPEPKMCLDQIPCSIPVHHARKVITQNVGSNTTVNRDIKKYSITQ